MKAGTLKDIKRLTKTEGTLYQRLQNRGGLWARRSCRGIPFEPWLGSMGQWMRYREHPLTSRTSTTEEREYLCINGLISGWAAKYRTSFGVIIPGDVVSEASDFFGSELMYPELRKFFRGHISYEATPKGVVGRVEFRLNLNKKNLQELRVLRGFNLPKGFIRFTVLESFLPQRADFLCKGRTIPLGQESFSDFFSILRVKNPNPVARTFVSQYLSSQQRRAENAARLATFEVE